MRDLARFVNRDALHQAYFNAALFLDGAGARLDAGNPYRGSRYSREGAFASLGGPDLLTLVSEVASRALKVVWRQKWLVHRRCRPEVFAGLLQMQVNGYNGEFRPYGLPLNALGSVACNKAMQDTLAAVTEHNRALNGGGINDGTLFLPMAFSACSTISSFTPTPLSVQPVPSSADERTRQALRLRGATAGSLKALRTLRSRRGTHRRSAAVSCRRSFCASQRSC